MFDVLHFGLNYYNNPSQFLTVDVAFPSFSLAFLCVCFTQWGSSSPNSFPVCLARKRSESSFLASIMLARQRSCVSEGSVVACGVDNRRAVFCPATTTTATTATTTTIAVQCHGGCSAFLPLVRPIIHHLSHVVVLRLSLAVFTTNWVPLCGGL